MLLDVAGIGFIVFLSLIGCTLLGVLLYEVVRWALKKIRGIKLMAGANRRAVNATLKWLKEKMRAEDEALAQLARSLADAVDKEPGNAALWREYRGAISTLLELAKDDTDSYADFIERLRAPVGDT